MKSLFRFNLSNPRFSLVLLMAFLFHQSLLVLSNPEPVCENLFQCGDFTIGFPFWGGSRPMNCGHRLLELRCEHDQTTSLRIEDVRYTVLRYTNSNQTLRLVRFEFDFDNSLCEPLEPDTTWDASLFEYLLRGYKNLTIFYGCQVSSSAPYSFTCGNDEKGLISTRSEAYKSCAGNFNLTVPQDFYVEWPDNISFRLKEVLEEGFGVKLKFNETACEECVASDGFCGFDDDNQICNCKNGTRSSTDCRNSPAGNKRNATVIGIAIASAVVAVALLAGVCFLVYRKRKRNVGGYVKSSDFSMHPSSQGTTTSATSVSVTRSTISIPSSKSDLGSAYFGVHVFSYAELEEATGNFSRELGDGGFGVVYYGKLKDGRAVAVKRLYENTLKRMEQFRNEIDILKSLQHPNLVKLYGSTSRHGRELLLVYEYIPNGTLADHLHGNRAESQPLAWPVRLNIAIDTANALAFLHDSGIIHRDVKTNNILLDNSFHVKVADFGLSRLFPTDVTHVSTAPQGTPGYVDPEYHQCYQLTEKSDVYSYGVVLIELISAKEAVDITRHRHDINLSNMAINRIQNQKLNELVDPRLDFEKDFVVRRMVMMVAELAFRCLQQEKELRPLMEEVVETLERIRKEVFGEQQGAEVVDICGKDDVGLLKNNDLPPLSPVQLHSFAFGEGKSTWEGLSNQSHYVKI